MVMNPGKKVYIETYGCQMNVYDSELIAGLMQNMEYELVDSPEDADAIFVNTCSVRENAEQRVWGQLSRFRRLKKIKPDLIVGVVGCMARNLEEEIHSKRPFVNLILGPDSYRKIPQMVRSIEKKSLTCSEAFKPVKPSGDEQPLWIDTELSREELYEDLSPIRFNATSAWIAIMRGCDNFCTYCVVPYTRGRERSRSLRSIVEEVRTAVDKGITEIGLLGQNVNSYNDEGQDFVRLLEAVSDVDGVRRIRFTSPHPKDLSVELIRLIDARDNICKHIHLPVQSGSNRILRLMNRSYTRESYLELVHRIRDIIHDVAITTDVIVGFPGETGEDFESTLDLFRNVRYDAAFTFIYSPRPGTKAFSMTDDVPQAEKSRRITALIELQRGISHSILQQETGKETEILIEEISKKSELEFAGRTGKYQTVIVPDRNFRIGDYVKVRITGTGGHTLFGDPVENPV